VRTILPVILILLLLGLCQLGLTAPVGATIQAVVLGWCC
jgi:hypothetical protein